MTDIGTPVRLYIVKLYRFFLILRNRSKVIINCMYINNRFMESSSEKAMPKIFFPPEKGFE